jgi:hypothetical protein
MICHHIPLNGNELVMREMPGFGQAAEILLFLQKDPKPVTPRSALLLGERKLREDGPTRCAQTRPAGSWGRPPRGQGGRCRWKKEADIVTCCVAPFLIVSSKAATEEIPRTPEGL